MWIFLLHLRLQIYNYLFIKNPITMNETGQKQLLQWYNTLPKNLKPQKNAQ